MAWGAALQRGLLVVPPHLGEAGGLEGGEAERAGGDNGRAAVGEQPLQPVQPGRRLRNGGPRGTRGWRLATSWRHALWHVAARRFVWEERGMASVVLWHVASICGDVGGEVVGPGGRRGEGGRAPVGWRAPGGGRRLLAARLPRYPRRPVRTQNVHIYLIIYTLCIHVVHGYQCIDMYMLCVHNV